MATIAYDLFDGAGELSGRVSPSGHTWVSVIPTGGEPGGMATSGGRLTKGTIPEFVSQYNLERAYMDVPFAFGYSVEYGVYWPTDGTMVGNTVVSGVASPSRLSLGEFDVSRFSTNSSVADAYDTDASLGRIVTSRGYWDTLPGAGGEHWIVKAVQVGLGFDYLTSTIPPMDSIGVASGLNKLRFHFAGPDDTRIYINNVLIYDHAGAGFPPGDDISTYRFVMQVIGAATVDYVAIYEGADAWDGSTGGGGGGGGGETERGWWTSLHNARQEP